ncbi:hypothetical protein SOVF_016320 [Spinacia oleracea]|nr:hypothetical protein SOVF_016320 [Spinacia oleracea]
MAMNSFTLFVAAILAIVAAVGAQETMAPSPAPATGAGFSLPASTAVVALSLLFSVFSLISKH